MTVGIQLSFARRQDLVTRKKIHRYVFDQVIIIQMGLSQKKIATEFIANQDDWKNTSVEWEWDGIESPHMTCDFCLQKFRTHQ